MCVIEFKFLELRFSGIRDFHCRFPLRFPNLNSYYQLVNILFSKDDLGGCLECEILGNQKMDRHETCALKLLALNFNERCACLEKLLMIVFKF